MCAPPPPPGLAGGLLLRGIGIAALALAAAAAASGAEPVTPLVSTAWVAERLDDPGLRLVHVALGHEAARGPFLPGAAVLDYHALETSQHLPVEMPPVEQLVAALRGVGISDASRIVLYGPAPAHLAARAFLTLEYLGHDAVSVMDGGLEAWIEEGRSVVEAPAAPTPGSFSARPRPELLVDADWIRERLGDAGLALIDARPQDQFEGASAAGLRDGHIPGAGNVYFARLHASEGPPRLRPPEEVRRLFEAAGAEPGDLLVHYCQIGMRASYTYLAARQLGYRVRFYDGSWADWGRRSDLPAEVGPAREAPP